MGGMANPAPPMRSTSQHTWDRFSASFVRELGASEHIIINRSLDLTSYADISGGDYGAQVARGLSGLGTVLTDRRPLSEDELHLYWSVTKSQADFGVTMQDALAAWHIGLDVLCQAAHNEVALDHHPREVLIDFLDLSVAWWRQGSEAAIAYYRQASSEPNAPRVTKINGLFWDIASRRSGKYDLADKFRALNMSLDTPYHALRVKALNAAEVERFQVWTGITSDPSRGESAVVGGQVWAILRSMPTTDYDAAVGTARAVRCQDLPSAFKVAGRALSAAASLGLTGTQSLDSLGVQSAVVLDHTLGDALVTRYVDPVVALGAIGTDVLTTVRAYISSHGNVDQASASLFVHPNTVRYRIRRFEEVIDASLRDTSTFMSVWWALERNASLGQGH